MKPSVKELFIYYNFLSGDPNDTLKIERFGVVQSSDDEARIISVFWLQFINNATEMIEEGEEDVSVYDIEDHQDYTFRIGEVIVRLATTDLQGGVESKEEKISPAGLVKLTCVCLAFLGRPVFD